MIPSLHPLIYVVKELHTLYDPLINLLFIDLYESHQNNMSNSVALYFSISFCFYIYRFISVVLCALYFEMSD